VYLYNVLLVIMNICGIDCRKKHGFVVCRVDGLTASRRVLDGRFDGL
jgi:hypothetical protein